MSVVKPDFVSQASLSGSMRDFRVPQGCNILSRVGGFFTWQDERRKMGVWPFARAAVTGARATVTAEDDTGRRMHGVNFASQDYLSLGLSPGDQGNRHRGRAPDRRP